MEKALRQAHQQDRTKKPPFRLSRWDETEKMHPNNIF